MLYLLYQRVELSNDVEADALVKLSVIADESLQTRTWLHGHGRSNSVQLSTIYLCPSMKQWHSSCTYHSTDFSDTCFLLGDSTITSFTLNFQTYSNCWEIFSFLIFATLLQLRSVSRSLYPATLLSWIAAPTVTSETSTHSSNACHQKHSRISLSAPRFLWTSSTSAILFIPVLIANKWHFLNNLGDKRLEGIRYFTSKNSMCSLFMCQLTVCLIVFAGMSLSSVSISHS